jgi:hypothetical protein
MPHRLLRSHQPPDHHTKVRICPTTGTEGAHVWQPPGCAFNSRKPAAACLTYSQSGWDIPRLPASPTALPLAVCDLNLEAHARQHLAAAHLQRSWQDPGVQHTVLTPQLSQTARFCRRPLHRPGSRRGLSMSSSNHSSPGASRPEGHSAEASLSCLCSCCNCACMAANRAWLRSHTNTTASALRMSATASTVHCSARLPA